MSDLTRGILMIWLPLLGMVFLIVVLQRKIKLSKFNGNNKIFVDINPKIKKVIITFFSIIALSAIPVMIYSSRIEDKKVFSKYLLMGSYGIGIILFLTMTLIIFSIKSEKVDENTDNKYNKELQDNVYKLESKKTLTFAGKIIKFFEIIWLILFFGVIIYAIFLSLG